MPENDHLPGESPASGDRRYSPNTTFPRDIGEDGLPVHERKPQGEEGDRRRQDPEDEANLGRS